ncbi:MAG: 50S ribosomal protein L10 [Candidatus Paceibacterota bacterium]
MAITKEKKKEILSNLEGIVKSSQSLVFVHFKGVSVSDTGVMRRKLRSEGVGYVVAKKTLMKRAFDSKTISGNLPPLEGEIAIAYGEDLLTPAREVHGFQVQLKNAVEIVGGVFDGVYKNKEEMMSIALIPSQKTLYAQFVHVIHSPIQKFAIALNAIAEKKSA